MGKRGARGNPAPVAIEIPTPPVDERPWFVYLLLCRGDRLYVGVTTELAMRMQKHRRGTGAKFTRSHPPERLLAARSFPSKGEALSVEHRLKQLSAAQKRALASAWATSQAIPDLPVL